MKWKCVEDAMKYSNIRDKSEVVYIDNLEGNRKQIRDWGVKQVFSPEEFLKVIGHDNRD